MDLQPCIDLIESPVSFLVNLRNPNPCSRISIAVVKVASYWLTNQSMRLCVVLHLRDFILGQYQKPKSELLRFSFIKTESMNHGPWLICFEFYILTPREKVFAFNHQARIWASADHFNQCVITFYEKEWIRTFCGHLITLNVHKIKLI